MTEKRLVAVCDILGFKNLIKTRDLKELIAGDLAVFRKLVGFSINHGTVPNLPPPLNVLREQRKVGFAWFSDTLLIYAKDDEDMSCRDVLEVLGWLLFTTMSTQSRLRGGVSYDEFYADPENEIYVGSSILEAHELEQAQEWSGVALAKSAANRIPKRTSTGARFQWWVCDYQVPLKSGKGNTCSNLAIDWTQGIHPNFDIKWANSHPEPTEAEKIDNKFGFDKWKNTLRFHQEVCLTCFPSNRGKDPLKVM